MRICSAPTGETIKASAKTIQSFLAIMMIALLHRETAKTAVGSISLVHHITRQAYNAETSQIRASNSELSRSSSARLARPGDLGQQRSQDNPRTDSPCAAGQQSCKPNVRLPTASYRTTFERQDNEQSHQRRQDGTEKKRRHPVAAPPSKISLDEGE